MFSLIIATLVASAAPQYVAPVTDQEALARIDGCLRILNGKATDAQITHHFGLDTPQKQRDFILGCKQFMIGVKVGQDLSKPRA